MHIIYKMVTEWADKLSPIIEEIKTHMITSSVVHFDKTGVRVNGKTYWVHNAPNSHYSYLTVEDKRGHKSMISSGILSRFKSIAVHDCWASYWKYDHVTHAICCAHLLRELTDVMGNHPE